MSVHSFCRNPMRLLSWLVPCLFKSLSGAFRRPNGSIHLLLCIADHYEPHNGRVDAETARRRIRTWVESYPRLFGRFRDSDGRPPQHTFFFPIEQYNAEYVGQLADLCRLGFGEVEIHLHHDRDTADGLRTRLLSAKDLLAERHGLLARARDTGEVMYGFVHGNWALGNSHPSGRWCGVNNELDVLRETGCYADFTFPSAPDPTQPAKINSIYYAANDPAGRRSHSRGIDLRTKKPVDTGLLLIHGPLVLSWRRRKWGLLPRIENGCIQGNQPASIKRLSSWLRARVQVPGRRDWFFVKLHTHGAPERNQQVLLGDRMVEFHSALAERSARDPNFRYHYVTAREMYNLARAAQAGWTGNVQDARDFELEAPIRLPSPVIEDTRASGRPRAAW